MLSAQTWACTLDIHDTTLAKGTRDNYARALDRFKEWMAAEQIGAVSWPLSEPLLCAFAASHTGHRSGGAARAALSGLRFEHDRRGLAWKGSPHLARILDAVGQMAPPSTKRKPRPPVTLAMVDEALKGLDPVRGFDQCVVAAMLVAFWGQARLGEILSPMHCYDYRRLPVVKHLRLRLDAGGLAQQETTALWLPQTRTARAGEWLWLTRHFNDPLFALQEHIADNRLGREDPLYQDDNDDVIPLTKNAFLGRLNKIWAASGMQSVSGHCFRIGGTTVLLRLGVDTDVVKMAGRWKSDAFLRYWRTVDTIIAAHTDLCDVFWSGDYYCNLGTTGFLSKVLVLGSSF